MCKSFLLINFLRNNECRLKTSEGHSRTRSWSWVKVIHYYH